MEMQENQRKLQEAFRKGEFGKTGKTEGKPRKTRKPTTCVHWQTTVSDPSTQGQGSNAEI